MQRKVVRIDYRFPYPVKCSAAQLKVVLHKLAGQWHGWERFPWRVTRHLHRFLLKLPVNFHYLMIHDCLEGFAAHLILTADFVDRDAVIEMMVRERFEVVGLLRVLLIDALRAAIKWGDVPYILDASGPEDGHKHVKPEEIERRRACFRRCVEVAAGDFIAILNGASLSKGLRGEMYGRTLRRWAEGELPETESLTVQLEDTMTGTMLRPCEEEVAAIAEAGRTIPTVVLEARERAKKPVPHLVMVGELGKLKVESEKCNAPIEGERGKDEKDVNDKKDRKNDSCDLHGEVPHAKTPKRQARRRGESGQQDSGMATAVATARNPPTSEAGKVVTPRRQAPKQISDEDRGRPELVRVTKDWKIITFQDGYTVRLHRRAKCRAYLRYVMGRCEKSGKFEFDHELFVEDYNKTQPEHKIQSERLEHDLFKNVAGVERLFKALDRTGQRFRLLVRVG